MKSTLALFLLAIAPLVPVTALATPAPCCEKNRGKGEECPHACCVKAAKEGKECSKCGGSGDVSKTKPEEKPRDKK